MTSRRLTETEKQQILDLYRQPGETTSTLASRFGVSNSTVSRILKNGLLEDEYEALIQQKRGGRSLDESATVDVEEPAIVEAAAEPQPVETPNPEPAVATPAAPVRRSRKRSSAAEIADPEPVPVAAEPAAVEQLPLPVEAPIEEIPAPAEKAPIFTKPKRREIPAPVAAATVKPEEAEEIQHDILHEELLTSDEDLMDLDEDEDEDDLDADFDEDDLEDGEELEAGALLLGRAGKSLVQVLPFQDAAIPRTCYLVVDRAAELIARPLKEFGDLGQIPEAEVQEKTLPVFDNHRVAKRFSNPRTQRIIKLPDSQVLHKTSSQLIAKGITRLLIDGQVYALR